MYANFRHVFVIEWCFTAVLMPRPGCKARFSPLDCTEMRFASSRMSLLLQWHRKLMCIVWSSVCSGSTLACPFFCCRQSNNIYSSSSRHACTHRCDTGRYSSSIGYWKLTELPERQTDYRVMLSNVKVSVGECAWVGCVLRATSSWQAGNIHERWRGLSESRCRPARLGLDVCK